MHVRFEIDMPDEWVQFRLPEGVQVRLQDLLDRQDQGISLTPEERLKVEGLVNLSELLSLVRSCAQRVFQRRQDNA